MITRPIFSLDGEGYSTPSGRAHKYTYLACCSEDELVSDLHDPKGIRTIPALEWLLSLARAHPKALLVGFSLGYDRTKWLEDLSPRALYFLHHPEERSGDFGPRSITWKGYRLNLVSSLFTVARVIPKGQKGPPSARVWDLFKFFQCSFVKALGLWKIGTQAERDRIEAMKARRGSFRTISKRERLYCQSECMLLSKLASELLSAHESEGLKLGSYYGPGSTASVILKGIEKDHFPDEEDGEPSEEKNV